MSTISNKLDHQKAAIYIRVSTHWQIDKDSLPLQRSDLANYVQYALDIHDYEIFEDAGYSGKNTDRPAFQQMLSRLRTGEFSHLVVWKIDRISRNLLDFASLYAELKKLGITFVSKNEQFDTSNAMGEAMLKIILVFAELERNMTSERVTAVMLSRAAGGQWNGGKIPFGYSYDKDSGTFSILGSEADTVRRIYDLYEEHHSLLVVARTLNQEHVYPRSGNKWNPTTVSIILKNPFYTGVYRYNYLDESKSGFADRSHTKSDSDWIVVEDHHPAIVTKEQQQRIMLALTQNRRTNKETSKTYVRKHTHIFAGVLECGICGSQLQATIDRPRSDGYRPSVYLCSSRRRSLSCTNKYVSDMAIAPFVLNYIANIIKAQNSFGKSTSIETFERKLLRGEQFSGIAGIDKAGLCEMYDMLRRGIISDAAFSSMQPQRSSAYDSERDALASERRKKDRALNRLQSLYLYSDEALSEREFLIERKSLQDAIDQIDKRLEEIDKETAQQFSLSDEDFMHKASMFIITNELTNKRQIDFRSLLRSVDNSVIKQLINSVIQKIVILDGRITSIRFKNGIEHRFLYE